MEFLSTTKTLEEQFHASLVHDSCNCGNLETDLMFSAVWKLNAEAENVKYICLFCSSGTHCTLKASTNKCESLRCQASGVMLLSFVTISVFVYVTGMN